MYSSGVSSVKALSESNGVALIPSYYHTLTDSEGCDDVADELAALIPVIDFSLLTSADPQIHAAAVRQLGQACQQWGFFIITNHGISENLMEDVLNKSMEFHNLPLEEKMEFSNDDLLPPIKYGTSALSRGVAENVHYCRDNLKVYNFQDQFNFPEKPPGFKEIAVEYSKAVRVVSRTLLEGISESLGIKPDTIIEHSGFDYGYQKLQVNFYPPCPQPDLALGLPPHTDNGFLDMLIQNGIGGLQLKHNGKWVNVNPLPNSLIVNTGDQLEVVSNGRYKSVWHRAVVNEKETRVSVVQRMDQKWIKKWDQHQSYCRRRSHCSRALRTRITFDFNERSYVLLCPEPWKPFELIIKLQIKLMSLPRLFMEWNKLFRFVLLGLSG